MMKINVTILWHYLSMFPRWPCVFGCHQKHTQTFHLLDTWYEVCFFHCQFILTGAEWLWAFMKRSQESTWMTYDILQFSTVPFHNEGLIGASHKMLRIWAQGQDKATESSLKPTTEVALTIAPPAALLHEAVLFPRCFGCLRCSEPRILETGTVNAVSGAVSPTSGCE